MRTQIPEEIWHIYITERFSPNDLRLYGQAYDTDSIEPLTKRARRMHPNIFKIVVAHFKLLDQVTEK